MKMKPFIFLLAGAAGLWQLHAADAPLVVTSPAVTLHESVPQKHVGLVVAAESVDIVARITGFLEKIHFQEGGMVKQGDLLLEIEDTTYQAQLHSAEAIYQEALAALDFAKTICERNSTLHEQKAVSTTAYDDSVRGYKLAQAQAANAKARLEDARNNLSYTKIYAPISGKIGKITKTRGNLVSPASGVLVTIEKMSPIYGRFALSERIFRSEFGGEAGFRKHAGIRLKLADDTIYSEKGKVALLDNRIDPRTNTMMIWTQFENKDGQLLPGSFVSVLLTNKSVAAKAAVRQTALMTDKEGSFIYVVGANNTIEKRRVKLGQVAGDFQEILSGVNPGEIIVVEGTHKAVPGKPVTPEKFTSGK